MLRTERRTRLRDIRPFVRSLVPLAAGGIPSIVLGDMNAPSHEDWTAATVGQRPQIRFPVRWPVSRFLAKEGFVDSYRAAFPDPVADEGLTWPAARPRSDDSWNPRRDAPEDRIDQIWSAGPASVVDSEVVGERGGPGSDISVHPWGSDHRAVVSTFDVTPGAPPLMVAPSPMLAEVGDALIGHLPRSGRGGRARAHRGGGRRPGDRRDRLAAHPRGRPDRRERRRSRRPRSTPVRTRWC